LRLPFAVDQIALMMQAGAEFEGSLQTVVRDNADHPLGAEMGEVLRQVSLGRPRGQALEDLRRRLDDKDVSELVFAINKGQELGTPLSVILREQADQMRLKRSQWGERAAQEAQVQMVFPGMLVMVACLIVIIAPILLPAIMMFLES
jgi:tight adherence protein C